MKLHRQRGRRWSLHGAKLKSKDSPESQLAELLQKAGLKSSGEIRRLVLSGYVQNSLPPLAAWDTLSAVYDGEQIRLEESYPLKPNTRLLVTVLDAAESEETEWYRFAGAGPARAYGPNEPEYTENMIKETNPEYLTKKV